MLVRSYLYLLALILGMAALPAQAAAPVHECDHLAVSRSDKDRVVDRGVSSVMDVERAISACTAALKSYPNEPRFIYQLGRAVFNKHLYREANQYFARAAQMGYVAAMEELGISYYTGEGITKNKRMAAKLFRTAAERGSATAKRRLGIMLVAGEGGAQDCSAGISLLSQAKREGAEGVELGLSWANDVCRRSAHGHKRILRSKPSQCNRSCVSQCRQQCMDLGCATGCESKCGCGW